MHEVTKSGLCPHHFWGKSASCQLHILVDIVRRSLFTLCKISLFIWIWFKFQSEILSAVLMVSGRLIPYAPTASLSPNYIYLDSCCISPFQLSAIGIFLVKYLCIYINPPQANDLIGEAITIKVSSFHSSFSEKLAWFSLYVENHLHVWWKNQCWMRCGFCNVKKNVNKQVGHSFEIVTLQEMTKWDQFLSSWNTDFLWGKKKKAV